MVIRPEGGGPCIYLRHSAVLVPLPASEDGQTGSDSVLGEKSVMYVRAHPGKEVGEAAMSRRDEQRDRQAEAHTRRAR